MLARQGSRVIITPQQEKSHKSETALYGESGLDPHQVPRPTKDVHPMWLG